MTRLAEIEAHLAGMEELREIVGAMRSLAGMRMQEAQRTLPGIRRYASSVAAGIADSLVLVGDPEPRPSKAHGHSACVLCMAEHGFVGGFNERLVEAAEAVLRTADLLFVLGTRGAALAAERGLTATWVLPMATRSAAAPGTVQRLSDELYRRIAEGEITSVEVIFAGCRQGSSPAVERSTLLPLDPAVHEATRPRRAPLLNLPPIVLHERLIGEYVFARLTEAVVESIASENAARLAAMESAHDNVSQKLGGLRQDARQARQQEITTEILELVTAAKALVRERV